jgi:hypothetical protein
MQAFASPTLTLTSFSPRHTYLDGIVSTFSQDLYMMSPSITPQQVLDIYNQSLLDISASEDTNKNIKQYVCNILEQMDVCFRVLSITI